MVGWNSVHVHWEHDPSSATRVLRLCKEFLILRSNTVRAFARLHPQYCGNAFPIISNLIPILLICFSLPMPPRSFTSDDGCRQQLFGIDKLNVVRSTIPAITHVDNSARVQTVNKDTNPRYHALISRFEEVTGCAVIVNTSFNVRDEPIVCTPEDAYRCFIGSELDLLVVENAVVWKESQLPRLPADAPRGDMFIPSRLLACLKPPNSSDNVVLERSSSAFRDRKSGTIYPDQNCAPSLLTGVETKDDHHTEGEGVL